MKDMVCPGKEFELHNDSPSKLGTGPTPSSVTTAPLLVGAYYSLQVCWNTIGDKIL